MLTVVRSAVVKVRGDYSTEICLSVERMRNRRNFKFETSSSVFSQWSVSIRHTVLVSCDLFELIGIKLRLFRFCPSRHKLFQNDPSPPCYASCSLRAKIFKETSAQFENRAGHQVKQHLHIEADSQISVFHSTRSDVHALARGCAIFIRK